MKVRFFVLGAIVLSGLSLILYGMSSIPGTNFMPHGHCFQLRPEIVYPYVVGHIATAFSYFLISVKTLQYKIRKAPKGPHSRLFYLFSSFTFLCALCHAIMTINVWEAWYYLEAFLTLSLGIVSSATGVVILLDWDKVVNMKTVEELEEAYLVGLAQTEVFLDALIVHNRKKILYVNDGFTRIFGYSEGEVLGSYYDKLNLFPEDEKEMIQKRIAGRVWGPYTTVGVNKDGKRVDMIVNAKAMKWKGQDARAVSFRDISEQVFLQRKVRYLKRLEEDSKTIASIRDSILRSLQEYKTDPGNNLKN